MLSEVWNATEISFNIVFLFSTCSLCRLKHNQIHFRFVMINTVIGLNRFIILIAEMSNIIICRWINITLKIYETNYICRKIQFSFFKLVFFAIEKNHFLSRVEWIVLFLKIITFAFASFFSFKFYNHHCECNFSGYSSPLTLMANETFLLFISIFPSHSIFHLFINE